MTTNTRQAKRKKQIRIFTKLLEFSAVFAKSPRLKFISDFILRRFADITFWFRKGQQQETVEGLAKEWQRMFPSKAFVPIKNITEETAYAEILGTCPVTASGDVHACYRLMEYDRHLLKKMGGQFVVLNSKANPAFPVCQVAIRARGSSLEDLIPAHQKPSQVTE